jgi:amino-acid N-acetyltransferase
MSVTPLDPSGREAAKALLEASGLPVSDLTSEIQLLGEWYEGGLVGVIGLEVRGATALLRSLAVATTRRGSGRGSGLVSAAERLAIASGIRELYLLTTTAESFFARRGYQRLPREAAPDGIRRTVEFSSICPTSSAFMRKVLA